MSSYPKLNEWMERYELALRQDREARPERYLWGDEKMQEVLDRMRDSFARGPGHFNKDSNAIRSTCKHFGLPYTYTSIDTFLRGVNK